MLPHRDSSSIFPRSSVCCPAFALGLCGFATAQRALVAALLLFGLGNNGRDLQPPSVPVHGDEDKISGCNFLARRGDVVLHQDLHLLVAPESCNRLSYLRRRGPARTAAAGPARYSRDRRGEAPLRGR